MRLSPSLDQIRAAMETTEGDPAWSESRRLFESGRLPSEMFQTLAIRPDILTALRGLGPAVYPGGSLEGPLQERVIVQVSRLNECQYCAASHTGAMQRLGLDPEALSTRERLALAYTRAAVTDSNAVPDAVFADLREAFTEGEIVELTFLIGLSCLLNLFNNCLQVHYHDDYAAVDESQGEREQCHGHVNAPDS